MHTAVFLTMLTIWSAPSQRPDAAVSVCQILQNLSQFVGKIIMVEAEWDGEQGTLIDECPSLVLKGKTWPNQIVLQPPNDPGVQRENPAGWSSPNFDIYSFAHRGAWAQWEKLDGERKEQTSVLVTVLGRLDSRLISENAVTTGYGHLGFAPARLVVIEIRGIALKRVNKRIARPFPSGPPVAR
jgi:hypothetical protein